MLLLNESRFYIHILQYESKIISVGCTILEILNNIAAELHLHQLRQFEMTVGGHPKISISLKTSLMKENF